MDIEIKDFIQNFAEVFEETDTSAFAANTVFRNIFEWDSMLSLSVIAMTDEIYNVKLTGDDIRNSETILDLFNIVKSRL